MEDQIHYKLPSSQDVDKDELFVCPYDPVHRISSKRYSYHIVKCRKNHPHIETETCPFNARHIIRKPDIRYHMSICPDKGLVELEMHKIDFSETPNNQPAIPEVVVDFQTDEDWGKEVDEAEQKANQMSVGNMMSSGSKVTKKVNSRREAIKKMKEEMRQKALQKSEDMQYEIRRPFHSPDVLNLGGSFQDYRSRNRDFNDFTEPVYTLPSNNPLSISTRPGAKLAANFSSVGRGRSIRELAQNGGLQGPQSGNVGYNSLLQSFTTQAPEEANLPNCNGQMYSNVDNCSPIQCTIRSSQDKIKLTNCNRDMQQDVPETDSQATSYSENPDSLVRDSVDWGNDGLQRRKKKLMKLLKQIHTLEQKVSSGVKLLKEEQDKVGRKNKIEDELENINQRLANDL